MKPKTRQRNANKDWKTVFQIITKTEEYQKGITLNDVLKVAEAHNIPTARETIRVKLHRYTAKGVLKKIDRGKYQVTPDGYKYFGIEVPNKGKDAPKWGLKPKGWASKKVEELRRLHQSIERLQEKPENL